MTELGRPTKVAALGSRKRYDDKRYAPRSTSRSSRT